MKNIDSILWLDDEDSSNDQEKLNIKTPEKLEQELQKLKQPYLIANEKFIKEYFGVSLKHGQYITYDKLYKLMVVCNATLSDGKLLSNIPLSDEEDEPELRINLSKGDQKDE